MSVSMCCWQGVNRVLRRSTVNPLRRSQLRDELRADTDRWTALVKRHGTPLLVLQPHMAARQYRRLTESLPGFARPSAGKAQPQPALLTTIAICGGGFYVPTNEEVALLRRLGLPMDRCIHTN